VQSDHETGIQAVESIPEITEAKKVKFALQQAMKAQRGSRGIAVLFL
jgi:hypothetical protein